MEGLFYLMFYAFSVPAVAFLYHLASQALTARSDAYRTCTPERQRYIVSNLAKAAVLGASTIFLAPCWAGLLMGSGWPCGPLMRLVAPAYVSLDLISLFWVENHQTSTLAHHIAVVVCGLGVALWEARPGTVVYHVCVFALFSALAWPANLYLGGRFLVPRNSRARRLSAAGAALVYAVVYVAHMSVHLRGMLFGGGWLYLMPLLFGVFVVDDIKLMWWLLQESLI